MSHMNTAPTHPIDIFSKFMGCQCEANSMDKETIKKNFVNTSMLMYKAKKTARETDLYLKKLNNSVLPRCRSAEITSNIVNSRSIDTPSRITRESQNMFKKQLDQNIKKNEKSMKILKPNLKSNFEESVINAHKIKDPQEISHASKLTESVKENPMNNVGVVNIGYEDKTLDEEENNKFKNLTVQKIPRVDLKPNLVTQKLASIQIKPNKKKTEYDLMSNVAYSNFTFESESRKCTCQPMIQPNITKDKKVARNEISKILYEMLENKFLNDELTNKLQNILINLEEPNPLLNNYSSQLENLVEQHSMVDLNENIIKNRLLEIAKNVFENKNKELSFDQMSIEIERNSQQLLERLAKIKNSILTAINPSNRFLKDDNQQDHNVVNKPNGNHSIQHTNNSFYTKNFQSNEPKATNRFISVKEYLSQGSKNYFKCSKKFENEPVVKKSGSKVPLCTKDSIILNPSVFSILNTQSASKDDKITHQLKETLLNTKKYPPKSKNEDSTRAAALEEHKHYDKMSKQSTQEIENDGESSTTNCTESIFCVMEKSFRLDLLPTEEIEESINIIL